VVVDEDNSGCALLDGFAKDFAWMDQAAGCGPAAALDIANEAILAIEREYPAFFNS
jgi:hypothetical protein